MCFFYVFNDVVLLTYLLFLQTFISDRMNQLALCKARPICQRWPFPWVVSSSGLHFQKNGPSYNSRRSSEGLSILFLLVLLFFEVYSIWKDLAALRILLWGVAVICLQFWELQKKRTKIMKCDKCFQRLELDSNSTTYCSCQLNPHPELYLSRPESPSHVGLGLL
jgi:hypothetical protein